MIAAARVALDNDVCLRPPVRSVNEAIERMEELAVQIATHEPRGERDGLGSFNYLYTVITKRVRDGIQTGFFEDRNFLTELDIAFTNRYFDALRADLTAPEMVPDAWRVLLDRRDNEEIEPMQFAVAGVNAHVNFDLAIAVIDTCARLRTSPSSGTQRSDYRKVNEIFFSEMQALRQHYETGFERHIDGALSPMLNLFCDWSVVFARDAAWKSACKLWKFRQAGQDESEFVEKMDHRAAMAGTLILTPVI